MSVWLWIAVAAVGALAAIARALVDLLIAARAGREFPFGTLAVNASASLILGLLTGLALSGTALLLAGTATVGSYSTFSTWMLETERLGEQRRIGAAAANVVLSLAIGVGAAALGRRIA
jgi:CrcB protein